VAPNDDKGEESGDSTSLKSRDLESNFSAVDSKDPLADDISVSQ